ncbi:hypothetical protein MMC30_004195 [Trapelia coarctata]|nr:hypothetical protein [Trapelia coarctata]
MPSVTALLLSALLATTTLAGPLAKRVTPRTNYTAPLTDKSDTIVALELAATAVDRLAILTDPSDFVFDFQNAGTDAATKGKGGKTVKADRKTFPALIGTGVSMTVGFLGPCGFNTPHVHPRSSEINIVVQGSLVAEFVAENGARPIINTLTQYQMTVFPQGAMHTEFNPLCTPSVFVAGFASEDPGVQQTVQSFFALDGEIVRAALGGEAVAGVDIEAFRGVVPRNVAVGVESCLVRCGLVKKGNGTETQ